MKPPTFKQRFQYWFDNYMLRGTGAVIAVLADQDKVEMENAIRERIPDTKKHPRHLSFGQPH